MNIAKKAKARGQIISIHGKAGSAKTTLSCMMNDGLESIMFDLDDSVSQDSELDGLVEIIQDPINDIGSFVKYLEELYDGILSGKFPYKNIVIDSLDDVQRLCVDAYLKSSKLKNMETLKFGSSWKVVQEDFSKVFNLIRSFKFIGVNMFLNIHSDTKMIDSPELREKISEWNFALNGKNINLVENKSDVILFIYDKIGTIKYEDVGTKATTNNKVIITSSNAFATAKNRHGLDPEIVFPKDDQAIINEKLVVPLGLAKTRKIVNDREDNFKASVAEIQGNLVPNSHRAVQHPNTQQPENTNLSEIVKNKPTLSKNKVVEPARGQPTQPPVTQPPVTQQQTIAPEQVSPEPEKATFAIDLMDKLTEFGLSDEQFIALVSMSPSNDYTTNNKIEDYDQAYVDDLVNNKWHLIMNAYETKKSVVNALATQVKL